MEAKESTFVWEARGGSGGLSGVAIVDIIGLLGRGRSAIGCLGGVA